MMRAYYARQPVVACLRTGGAGLAVTHRPMFSPRPFRSQQPQRNASSARDKESFHRVGGMPEIIEKWGRKPFYTTSTLMFIFSVGAGLAFDSPLVAAALGLPTAAFTFVGLNDLRQKQHTVLRNFPVLGHVRYLFEAIRPEIRQYFIESELEANPFTREHRSLIYQRAKGDVDNIPFGTRRDVYQPGYEWVNHSIYPKEHVDVPRIRFGNSPGIHYDASLFNISALSFGAISANAIRALNQGAKMGNFFHNTGEGGVSKYHLENGGDIVWNIGTGYFSCRDKRTGEFDPELYKKVVSQPQIKMCEIKLSQGAKPGKGGILPGPKVTPEIAETRGVIVGEDCMSPSKHRAFSDARGLIRFASELRSMSNKPVGIKLCVGNPVEIAEIIAAMVESNTYLDFVTVDGKEGGTGAAPSEYTNHVGTPLVDGLYIVNNLLVGAGIRDKVRVIASGKITSGFSLFRALALGADVGNSARGFMFSLGCIQSLKCHTNKCPTGIATQELELQQGLVVPDKADRVCNFHKKTVEACLHLVASTGMEHPRMLNSSHVLVRTSQHQALPYSTVKPPLHAGELLSPSKREHELRPVWEAAVQNLSRRGENNLSQLVSSA